MNVCVYVCVCVCVRVCMCMGVRVSVRARLSVCVLFVVRQRAHSQVRSSLIRMRIRNDNPSVPPTEKHTSIN